MIMRCVCVIGLLLLGGDRAALGQGAPASRPGAELPASQPAIPTDAQLNAMSAADLLDAGQKALAARKYEAGVAYANKILEKDAANIEGLLLRADCNIEMNRIVPARTDYTAVLNAQKGDFRANYGMGRIWVRGKYWKQATHYLEDAVRVAPPDRKADALVLLARTAQANKAIQQALDTVTQALQLKPDSVEGLDLMATLQSDLGKLDLAMDNSDKLIAVCKEAFARNPADPQMVSQLNSAYITRLKVLSGARETLFARDARGAPIDQVLPGKEREAAGVLNQILEAMIVRHGLEATLQYHDLMALAERMVQYDPQNAQYQLQYGLLLLKIYDNEKAADAFRKVLEIDPNNAEARNQLEQMRAAPPPASEPATP